MESLLDGTEVTSDDGSLNLADPETQAIHKQLQGLESMYSQVSQPTGK